MSISSRDEIRAKVENFVGRVGHFMIPPGLVGANPEFVMSVMGRCVPYIVEPQETGGLLVTAMSYEFTPVAIGTPMEDFPFYSIVMAPDETFVRFEQAPDDEETVQAIKPLAGLH